MPNTSSYLESTNTVSKQRANMMAAVKSSGYLI